MFSTLRTIADERIVRTRRPGLTDGDGSGGASRDAGERIGPRGPAGGQRQLRCPRQRSRDGIPILRGHLDRRGLDARDAGRLRRHQSGGGEAQDEEECAEQGHRSGTPPRGGASDPYTRRSRLARTSFAPSSAHFFAARRQLAANRAAHAAFMHEQR
ncbi:hypothetical protein GCM10011322_37560 [Salinarimonas ramus]|uniref:Uncharacterized protein n=1 Tax=Salinarimonas ramus TaxID=690164 RepID=A0A917V7B1_9HYPH|nr:hypothetical protein GCM10011322_37560 [Salinarimonas ramus]